MKAGVSFKALDLYEIGMMETTFHNVPLTDFSHDGQYHLAMWTQGYCNAQVCDTHIT